MQQIAKEIKSDNSTVKYYLIKHNIPIRTQGEQQKGNKNGLTHGKTVKISFCIDCNKKLSKHAYYCGYTRCKKCNYEFYSGKRHWLYIKNLIRKYPKNWTLFLKESIRVRDNHVCQICGKTAKKNGRAMDVHHIDYVKNNLNPENLISLCISCHMSTGGNRDIYIEYFRILKEIL